MSKQKPFYTLNSDTEQCVHLVCNIALRVHGSGRGVFLVAYADAHIKRASWPVADLQYNDIKFVLIAFFYFDIKI